MMGTTPHVEKLKERVPQIEVPLFITEIIPGEEHLTDGNALFQEKRFVHVHKTDLADGGARLFCGNCRRALIKVQGDHAVRNRAGRNEQEAFSRIDKKLGCQVTELYCDMDGRFPNHHPDPTVEKNVAEIRQRVVADKADVGIAYDGDADRIGVIDDKGGILWGDILMILFSRALLKSVPGATIIGEVKCSHRLFDDIEAHGGKPLMWKAGHSLIKAKMKEVGAQLGGEMSGHIFYKNRWFGFDDAIYTSARVLEILSQNKKPLSELLADVPPAFTTPELRIKSSDEKKFRDRGKGQTTLCQARL